MSKKIKKLCVCGMLAALIFVITAFVSVPAGAYGNINLGDAFIIIATFILGPYGAICGGIGAMIADLIGAYAIYAPGTLIIKALLSLACYFTYKGIKNIIRFDLISRLIGALCGEAVMVLGYFLYEWMLFGISTAVISIPFNVIQGGASLVLGTIISYLLTKNKLLNKYISIDKQGGNTPKTKSIECPHCGANTVIVDDSGVCEYCKSHINL